jgi:endothelin-converting enzyme/putative endopeptidase
LLLTLLASFAAGQTGPQFSPSNMDLTADPCVDFYRYACGGWMAKNPIPPDQSAWSMASELVEHNREVLRNILEKASAKNLRRTPDEQKIGDFYASCMDESGADKLGTKPLKPDLDRIQALANKAALVNEIVRLHLIGVSVFFRFSSGSDLNDSRIDIGQADQGGLSLPDRDYYLKDDPHSVELRRQYAEHVQKMMQLLGDSAAVAAAEAQAILRLETALAKYSLDRVSRRDPTKTYHKLPTAELSSLCPLIDWPKYFRGVAAPAFTDLNIAVPDFFRGLDSVLGGSSLDDLKAYLRWHLVHSEAAFLSQAFVNEDFRFFRQILTGAKEIQPRWKRCVAAVDDDLGFALGQKFVEETFGAEGKARTLRMVEEIEKAMGEDIRTLSWMTPATKQEAQVKLRAVANKIGYPDKPRDYSAVKIVRGDAVGNDERATEFEVRRRLNMIGKPVDHTEWFMTPQTVNAYYNPPENNINFPAGILQPPFFDKSMDAAVNYGSIGAIVGHELTHGFDDQGRRFDAQGNLKDWWTPQDAQEFEKRAQCFIDEYSAFKAVDDVPVNGKLTLGENTADNGGLRLAFIALMHSLEAKPQAKIDGFTPEQRFFLAYGQDWCQNTRPETARLRAQVDPHSPPKDRANGVVENMPEFQQAFACRVGQPMVREPACRVW